MKRFRKTILLLLTACLLMPAMAEAKAKDETVYIFGYGASLEDSIVCITAIQALPNTVLQKGTDFLPHRAELSAQLNIYLANNWGMPNTVCTVFFNKKKHALEKKLLKVRRLLRNEKQFHITELRAEDFAFEMNSETN